MSEELTPPEPVGPAWDQIRAKMSEMVWTPEAYLKIMKVDAEQLHQEILEALAAEDKSYQIGQGARMVGKLSDNLALLARTWREARRPRA